MQLSRKLLFLTFVIPFVVSTSFGQVEDLAHEIVRASVSKTDFSAKGRELTVEVRSASAEYNGVVLHGWTESDSLSGKIRFLEDAGWTDWLPMLTVRSVTTPAFFSAYRGAEYRPGSTFQFAFSGDTEDDILINQVGTFDNRLDEDRKDQAGDAVQWFRDKALELVPSPYLYRRTDWNADPYRGTPRSLGNPISYLTFHHAAGFKADNLVEGIAQVKAIQVFHQDGRGWDDIGYQFVIDRAGNLYQGRPFLDESMGLEDIPPLALGAHVGGANTGNIGVCLLGCYHPPETSYPCNDVITQAAYDKYVHLFAYLRQSYGVSKDNIFGHRDYFGTTSCPGDNNYQLLPQLRADVEQAVQSGLRELPDDFSLAANFPNPFSDETYIEYYLTADGNVKVQVFDVLGREVADLVDEYQVSARRWRQVRFDASSLPAGLYIYQITVEGFSGTAYRESRPMMLVR